MPSMEPSANARREFLHSTEFFVRIMPDLDRVRRSSGEWDLYGSKVADEAAGDANHPRSEISLWDSTKRLLFELAEGTDARHSATRNRMRSSGPANRVLFSELSLWLAGELKISITVTKRLVAAALIGVASADGDWKVLAS